jgi:hypothetical protein
VRVAGYSCCSPPKSDQVTDDGQRRDTLLAREGTHHANANGSGGLFRHARFQITQEQLKALLVFGRFLPAPEVLKNTAPVKFAPLRNAATR